MRFIDAVLSLIFLSFLFAIFPFVAFCVYVGINGTYPSFIDVVLALISVGFASFLVYSAFYGTYPRGGI